MAGTQTDNLLLLDLTTGLARTTETGGTPDVINTSVDWEWVSGANVVIDGNLTVNGTTTTIHSEQVNIRDNHLYLNADYTTTVAQTGGFVVNVLPTATADSVAGAFTAGVGAVSNPTVITTGSATFAVGDIIQIAGADNQSNDQIYEVLSHVGTTLTIRGIGTVGPTVPWVANDFTADTVVGGDIRIVNVNVLEGDSSGNWSTATVTNTTGIVYNTFTTQGLVDLQVAYVEGNTITTSGGEGDVTFAGTETFVITTAGGVNLDAPFDFDSTSFDVQMTGSNGFSIDGTAASNVSVTAGDLTLSSLVSGSVLVDGVDGVEINSSGGALALGNDADTGAINIGTGAAARTITLGNATGATSVNLDAGTGGYTYDATVSETVALSTHTTTGTGGDSYSTFVGGLDPSAGGGVAAVVGSIYHRDVGNAGTSGEMYIKTGAADTAWTVIGTGSGNSLQLAYVAGNTILTDAGNGPFDISGTEAISLDASGASNFTVASASLSLGTTTAGAVDVTSAGILDLDAVGALGINSSGGAIDIGGDADAFAINIGTGAAARTITIGNATGATGVDFDSGTAGFTFDSTVSGAVAFATVTTSGAAGDSVEWFVSDTDPSAAAGIAAPVGSTLWRDAAGAGTAGEMWIKVGAADTAWEQVATGDTSETLQEAYEAGNAIVTDGANGDFDVSGTEAVRLDASSASNFTVDSASLTLSTTTSGTLLLDAVALLDVNAGAGMDVDVTGTYDMLSTGAFSIDGTGASNVTATSGDLALSALTTGEVLIDGVGGVEINSSGGDLDFGNDADTGAINIGTGASARAITLGNATGATGIVANVGTGEFAINSTVGEADPVMTLTTTGASGDAAEMFVGDNDPSGSVTGLAGSLFMRDTATGGELYINNSTGSGTTWLQVATTADVDALDLQTAYENGNTIVTSAPEGAFDVSGTEAISLDASAASNFSVASANLTLETTTAGTLDLNSAADIDITFATANTTALVIDDGTNTYMTFDSTVAEPAVAVEQFLDIVGSGAGVTLTAGEALIAGAVVTIEGTTGDAILADSNTGTTLDGLAIGVAAYGAADTAPVKVFTVPGSLIPVNFAAAPAAALNGRPVFVSQTPGQGITTAPTGSGNVVYIVGILQGADGASTSPLVMYQPQFISVRP